MRSATSARESAAVHLGIDVGGTFTDLVAVRGAEVILELKVPSSPPEFATGIAAAVDILLARADVEAQDVSLVLHGTTVATNAVLERRGARTGLITTKGFRDVLELRRLRRPTLFDTSWDKPEPLVPRELRLELNERIGSKGEVLRSIDEAEVEALVSRLKDLGVESVAVCFLNSYANPSHELEVAELVRASGEIEYVSPSNDVSPEIKEYERTSSTVVNAYLQPVVAAYVNNLVQRIAERGIAAPILIMKSNGGLASAAAATRVPAAIVESGPAAGSIAAARLAVALGIDRAIAFDMGGTTAKVTLVENGFPLEADEYEVGAGISAGGQLGGGSGYTLRFPSLDIAEVGAGGGSVVWLDRLGTPHVGPQSAGATPGPVCYGRGGARATVTDANALLGYLSPDALAGGAQEMHLELARAAFLVQIAEPLEMDIHTAAHGIYMLANSEMGKALRSITTERGRDPRDYVLIAYGGAGPLHAVQLARDFGIGQVVVPPGPGVFSAAGLLVADITYDETRTIAMVAAPHEATTAQINTTLELLEEKVVVNAAADGWSRHELSIERVVSARYRGQFFELTVPIPHAPVRGEDLRLIRESFDREHERAYGRAAHDEDVELVNVRVRARQASGRSLQRGSRAGAAAAKGSAERMSFFGGADGLLATTVLRRWELGAEPRSGPLIIEDPDSTTVVPPGATAALGSLGEIQIATAQA